MSSISQLPSPPGQRPPGEDPFRFGWRYVSKVLPDGSPTREQVPLTLEDVLHPHEGDFRVHSREHWQDCEYLSIVFKRQVVHDATALVLADHRLAWDDPDIRPHGPDIAVYFGVEEGLVFGSTFDVAEHGVRPRLIVEIVSPESRVNDVVTKLDEYYRAGVLYYVIVDTTYRQGRRTGIKLLGYHHTPEGYAALPLDERGWLWLEDLDVWLGTDGVQVACFDRDGKRIGDYTEVSLAWEAEVKARAAAEAKAKRSDKQKVEAEKQKAEAELKAKQLEQEKDEANRLLAAAELRVRELEELFRRKNGPTKDNL